MNRKVLVLIACILLVSSWSYGQLFEGDEYDYNTEWIWGVSKHSNGGFIGGFILRYSRSRGDNLYETYGIELANVKHPSESRYAGLNGQTFSYGKTNYLYAVRMRYGRDRLLFKKANQQGVQVNVNYAGGLSLGVVTPYYVLASGGSYQQFDPVMSPESILGPGKLFQGLGESSLQPGLNLKGAISFEFGSYRNNVIGAEVGIVSDIYTSEVEIVPTQPNKAVYNSVFLSLFWGSRR